LGYLGNIKLLKFEINVKAGKIMKCMNCGESVDPNDKFCMRCGSNLEEQKANQLVAKTCPSCGNNVSEDDKFCGHCGYNFNNPNTNENYSNQSSVKGVPEENSFTQGAKNLFGNTTKSIGKLAGNEESLNINLKDMFSEVFKKHTKEESDEIFIAGTKSTTPKLDEISEEWGRPWLFSRVFLAFAITFAVLWVLVNSFENELAIPGLIFIGALMVPLSCLFFFYESNAFKNISLFEVMKMFFIGGVLSLLSTMFLYGFVTFSDEHNVYGTLTIIDAFLVGLVEETGKALIIVYFINKMRTNKILNGLLIGAAIGAGFAVFESAGYILTYSLSNVDNLTTLVFIRSWTAIGTHIVWSAIIGAVIIIAKDNTKFSFNNIGNKSFLFFFFVSVLLHTIWDTDITLLGSGTLKYVVLIVIAWIFVFILMKAGLNQIDFFRNEEALIQQGENE